MHLSRHHRKYRGCSLFTDGVDKDGVDKKMVWIKKIMCFCFDDGVDKKNYVFLFSPKKCHLHRLRF